MDKKLKDEWAEALDSLLTMEASKRKHFAMLIVSLAKCYTINDEWQAVVIVHNEDALLTFSVGADEAQAAEMLQHANDAVLLAATTDAPPKEMFN